jgi:geranylgeranyl pyrophosphate synthase
MQMRETNTESKNDHAAPLTVGRVVDLIRSLPGIDAWDNVISLLFGPESYNHPIRQDWMLPAYGYQAVSGGQDIPIHAVAAMACLQTSISLIDDILDEETNRIQSEIGVGRTANVSFALHAVSHLLIDACSVAPELRNQASRILDNMAITTAIGQDLDVQNAEGEQAYWSIVRAKSAPFYSAGIESGAVLAGATKNVAQILNQFGAIFGEMIQIVDDLEDAFCVPAKPDWNHGRNNLATLYALTAEYPKKTRFIHLMGETKDTSNLKELHQILIDSGAVSYCVFSLMQRQQQAMSLVRDAGLKQRVVLEDMLRTQVAPVKAFVDEKALAGDPMYTDSFW